MTHKRVNESRLERVQEINEEDPNARQQFEKTYQDCGIPLWLRTGMSTFIEKQHWSSIDKEKSKRLFTEFISEAFKAVPNDERLIGSFDTVREIQSKYEDCSEMFIVKMKNCMDVELNIIQRSSSLEALQSDPSYSAEIAVEAYQKLIARYLCNNNSKKQRTMQSVEETSEVMSFQKDMKKVDAVFQKEVQTCLEHHKKWQIEADSVHYRDKQSFKETISSEGLKQRFQKVDENFKKIKECYERAKESHAYQFPAEFDEAFQNISTQHQNLVDRSFVLEGSTKRIFSMEKKKHEDTFRITIISLLEYGIRHIDSIGLYDKDNKPMAKVKFSKFEVSQASLDGVSVGDFMRTKSQNCASEACYLKIDIKATTGDDSAMKSFKVKSGPCLCASHTQVAKATGLLIWMMAFPSAEGQYHAEVDWKDFLSVLSSFWAKETGGCTLSDENAECLAEYFGNNNGLDTFKISHSKVFDEKVLPQEVDKKKWFTMWEWFNGCINLVKKYPDLFRKRLIHGLVTKARARKMLNSHSRKDGVFLVRISQSFLDKKTKPYAGLSIAVLHCKEKGKYDVINGDIFSINYPGDTDGVLPGQGSFGRWLMCFAAESYDYTKVFLTHLCGRTELVGQTFAEYTKRYKSGIKHRDYRTFEQIRVYCKKVGQATHDVSPGHYNQLMELIPKLHHCCEISPPDDPYFILLKSPNPQSETWSCATIPQSGMTPREAAESALTVDGTHDESNVHPEETTEYGDPTMDLNLSNAFPTQNNSSGSSDLSPEDIVMALEDPNFEGINSVPNHDYIQLPSNFADDALGNSARVGVPVLPIASNCRPDNLADIHQGSPFSNSTTASPPQRVPRHQNRQSSKSNGQVVPTMSPLSAQSSPAESLSPQQARPGFFNGVACPNGRDVSPSMDILPLSVEGMSI